MKHQRPFAVFLLVALAAGTAQASDASTPFRCPDQEVVFEYSNGGKAYLASSSGRTCKF